LRNIVVNKITNSSDNKKFLVKLDQLIVLADNNTATELLAAMKELIRVSEENGKTEVEIVNIP